MGARKHKRAEAVKEARKNVAIAHLNDTPTSPYKMRLVADMIRGQKVELALHSLQYSTKDAAKPVYKLLRSAIANWEAKNEKKAENGELYISTIFVTCAPMLKRLRTAPQGRGYRIRKRSNHVTLFVDTIDNNAKKQA